MKSWARRPSGKVHTTDDRDKNDKYTIANSLYQKKEVYNARGEAQFTYIYS